MIIDAYATDTVPSHEVRRRALEALTNEGEPMSEVTYDALRKRLAQAEEELSIWKSVFPDIAPERVMPDRSLLHAEIKKLRAALKSVLDACDAGYMVERGAGGMTVGAQMRRSFYDGVPAWLIEEARAALGEKE